MKVPCKLVSKILKGCIAKAQKQRCQRGSIIFCDCPPFEVNFFAGVIACVFSACVFWFSTVVGHNDSNLHARSFARAHHSSFTVKEGCAFHLNGGSKRPPNSLTWVVESIISHPPIPFPSKTTVTLTDAATLHVLFFHNYHSEHDKTSFQPAFSFQSVSQTMLHCPPTTKHPQP